VDTTGVFRIFQKKTLMNVICFFFHLFFYLTDISVYLQIFSPKNRPLSTLLTLLTDINVKSTSKNVKFNYIYRFLKKNIFLWIKFFFIFMNALNQLILSKKLMI